MGDEDDATPAESRAVDEGDVGNPDEAPGVGARSGYGIDTGDENEGYPDASPSPHHGSEEPVDENPQATPD
jgi:hypothetical protein